MAQIYWQEFKVNIFFNNLTNMEGCYPDPNFLEMEEKKVKKDHQDFIIKTKQSFRILKEARRVRLTVQVANEYKDYYELCVGLDTIDEVKVDDLVRFVYLTYIGPIDPSMRFTIKSNHVEVKSITLEIFPS